MKALRILAAAAVAASGGCASPEGPFRAYLDAPSEQVRGCAQWYEALDRAIDGSGVRDAQPLIYDSIHACGCYHKFFPTPRARARPAPDPLEEWAFVPQRLPRVAEGERPLIRLASGTHYIEGVSLVRGIDSLARYIAGTERSERFLFWPSGIDSPGAMRQWGRHATAFVGRRHFDDADLIERRFALDLGEGGR